MDGGQKVSRGLIVTGGDCAVLLELGEEILDQVTRGVDITIECLRLLPIGLRWDHRFLSRGGERFANPLVRIKRLIGDQCIGLHIGQQLVGSDKVMSFATGQIKAGRIAKGIHQRVDLGAQSAARAADRLVLAVFF